MLSKSLPPASSKVGPYNSWLGHGECESYRIVPLDMESHGLYRMCLLVGHRRKEPTANITSEGLRSRRLLDPVSFIPITVIPIL